MSEKSKEVIRSNMDLENKINDVESRIVQILRTEKYTLNTVNSYGENLLHVSAANGCSYITSEILRSEESCRVIDRKNKFGWTPLMQAVRNRDVATVKILLRKNANVQESTYLDEYTLLTMKQSTVAAITNLAKIHFNVEDYWNDTIDNIDIEVEDDFEDEDEEEEPILNIYSPPKLNTNPELKYQFNLENSITNIVDNNNNNDENDCVYYETDNNIQEKHQTSSLKNTRSQKTEFQRLRLDLLSVVEDQRSVISPTLAYVQEHHFPVSPDSNSNNICYIDRINDDVCKEEKKEWEFMEQREIEGCDEKRNREEKQNKEEEEEEEEKAKSPLFDDNHLRSSSPVALKRLRSIRPPDLNISQIQSDHDISLGFKPEYNTPNPSLPFDSQHMNEESAYGDETPTPPNYRTPPRGTILNSQQNKMVFVLNEFGLDHYVPMFLKQEIDMDVFVTLTDEDLVELGVHVESERKVILNAVRKYQNMEIYSPNNVASTPIVNILSWS